jgi:hypothetical protein
MESDLVKIDEMCLNIPGLNQEAANMLGRDVIRHVGQKLPEKIRSRRLASLNVQVSIPQGTPTERLAEVIAEQICKSLV